ncbi:hypothetical protein DE146DRAFT_16744 [Phaeosphaeria sp. MPI-PUGE-AT-0046c]|nr:hypothetical protein DE146DRAFT_16744 [Phaeosphaeria sp. MPI-PUGE-AT-0046c]
MSSQIIFYDLPSRQGTSWSLNPWKTRMVLNYKKIDYKTEWIEYPDVEQTFKAYGIPPNDPDSIGYHFAYSCPTIRFPSGTYMQDSWPLAHELEKLYPSPSLHLSDPIVPLVRDQIAEIMKPLVGFFIPRVPVELLSERSAAYFYETRKKRFGMDLAEVGRTMATADKWEEGRAPCKKVGEWLREKEGPFFLGETVSYADFIFVGMLHMIKRIDEGLFKKFCEFDPAFEKLYEACGEWLQKDN